MTSLDSERFYYRKADTSDASFFLALLNDEDWLRYIGDRNVKTLAQAENYIENSVRPGYSNDGLGMKVICHKTNHSRLGLIGLLKRDYLDSIDLGYALLKSSRGKGVISESLPLFIHIAFNEIGSPSLYATVNSDNISSIRVLHANEFTRVFNQKEVADLPNDTLLYVRER